MFKDELAQALHELTCELRELRKERERELVSVQDLSEAEDRIIKAIRGGGGLSAEDAALLNGTLAQAKWLALRVKRAAKLAIALDDSTR
jgi:hypothetical protein